MDNDTRFLKKITLRLSVESRRNFKSALAFFDVGIQHALEAFSEKLVRHYTAKIDKTIAEDPVDTQYMQNLLIRAKAIQNRDKQP